MTYSYYSISNKGKRAVNEDSVYPSIPDTKSDLFMVCDGLGGHGNGDLASKFVVERLAETLKGADTICADKINEALYSVNKELQVFGKNNGNEEMGSTAVVLKLNGKSGVVGWVGDSRLYHFRDGELLFRTEDHTIVELYKKRGFLTGHDFYPNKNIIWQALGTSRTKIEPSLKQLVDIKPGDYFLLASDGLVEACEDEDLSKFTIQTPEKVFDEISKRCYNSSRDNFSFTLVSVG